MTAPDLDALEKLAESLLTLDSEERDWPLVKIHGRMFHVENAAKAASDGLKALIAELKEARGLLKPFAAMADAGDQRPKDDAVWAGQDGVRITYGDFRSAGAFLARNGERGG